MFNSRKHTKIASILLTPILLTCLISPGVSAADDTTAEKYDYLALGDSLAAGQTPDKEFDKGYTDYLAEKLDKTDYLGTYSNAFAVSGYTTKDVLDDIKDNVKKDGKSIRESIEEAEIITLDAGANDLIQQLDISDSGISIDPAKMAKMMVEVQDNLEETVSEIKEINKHADVYLMGYYNAFPYLPKAQQTQLLAVLQTLNKKIGRVASNTGARYVPTLSAINKDITTYVPNPLDIHLSKKGYQAVAIEFWDKIKEKFPIKKISFKEKSVVIKAGDTTKLTLNAIFPNGSMLVINDDATWKTSSKTNVTVKNGVLTAKKKGRAKITAEYEKKKISIAVKVTD